MAKPNSMWCGDLSGNLLVFDPSMQLVDSPHVFLWDCSSGEMGQYVASLVKSKIKTCKDHSAIAKGIRDYQQWHAAHAAAWLLASADYYGERKFKEDAELQQREAARATLEDARRTKAGKKSTARANHCWSCKKDINNSIHQECEVCRWIICPCGACERECEGPELRRTARL